MKILTSYYGQLKTLLKDHPNYLLVSISGFIPDEIKEKVDIHDKKLAPSKDIYDEYEQSKDWKKYTKRFKEEILSKIDFLERLESWESDALKIGKEMDTVVIICYENIGDFCHRHIIGEAIENEFKTDVKEFKFEDYKKVNYRLESISTDCLF